MNGASVALPSETMYHIFGEGSECRGVQDEDEDEDECCKNNGNTLSLVSQMWLKSDINLAREIEQNYCYARKMEHDETGNKWCQFFYFWLGDRIKDNLNNWGLAEIMGKIYSLLPEHQCKSDFYKLYDDVGEYIFPDCRVLFDYDYNINAWQGDKKCTVGSNSPEYMGQQAKAQSAYLALCNRCEESNDKCCTKFKSEYWEGNRCKRWPPRNLPKLTCTAERKPEHEDELLEDEDEPRGHEPGPTSMEMGKEALMKLHLEGLPSRMAYQDFELYWDTYKSHPSVNAVKSSLQPVLKMYPDISECLNKIVGAWYYVTNVMPTQNQSFEKRCEYFYYWLGSMMSSELGNNVSFSQVVRAIYTELGQLSAKNGCGSVPTTVNGVLFNQRKKIFDFWRDHIALRTLLKSSMFECTSAYSSYVSAVTAAYAAVEGDYERSSDQYWDAFWGTHKDTISKEIPNLACPDKPSAGDDVDLGDAPRNEEHSVSSVKGDGAQASEKELSKDSISHQEETTEGATSTHPTNATLPATISSVSALVGLATITFILYKVSNYNNYNLRYK
ncbi:KIR protein [Plasmodium coatneyi]|uniref:KIR protein n=1 Tax=Plasmodium coatneyi TaxID=208452 RepID=A0A1B1DXA8_9APIC|nr:KIR protein [Plasmodium coatneyi]ANQ07225.1 KIR protein [Plasmodium coatneyi]